MHASICDFILDITQNSIEANASKVELQIVSDDESLELIVIDNGKGMTEHQLAKAFDPFYSEEGKHNHRKVGLGIPFLKQAVEATEGSLDVQSVVGKGTTLRARFNTNHFDAPPLGNFPSTILSLMNFPGEFELAVTRSHKKETYEVSRSDLIDALGDLCDTESLILAKQYIESLDNELFS